MAMEMQEGFSIREYASRMRSVNVVKCWPFDETTNEETVKSLLPPITVKKFTWWLDELEYMHSESAKKVLEKEETSLRNGDQDVEESDIDVEEGMAVVKVKASRGKPKAPKKRSIVEIFAVAPPVERVSSEEEEEEDSAQEEDWSFNFSYPSHKEINWGLKGKRNEKKNKKKMMKKKNKDIILRKTKRLIKKIKKAKMDLSVENKENCLKSKSQAQDKGIGNPSSSYSKELENDSCDCMSILKRKSRLQHLDADKKMMSCKAFTLTEENQHPGLPVRGILKNHAKAFSLQQSRKCILQEAVQVNHCSTQKENKHVTFLEKDDILRRKPCHSIQCYKLRKVCGSDMGNVDHAGGVGKDSAIPETSGIEDVSTWTGKEVGAGPAWKEQLARCILNSTTFTKQNNEELFSISAASERSELHGMNQHLSDSGLRDVPHNPIYAYPPGFFYMPVEGYYNSPNFKVIRNSSNSTCRKLIRDLGTASPVFPLHFKDNQKKHNEASVSNLSGMEKRTNKLPQTSSQGTAMNNVQSFQFQTFPHLSSKEFLHTFCCLSDGNLTGNTCRRKSITGLKNDFVGLPLNSQGELITVNSSDKRDFNQMMKSSIGASHSISLSLPRNAISECLVHHSDCRTLDCRPSSSDPLNLFPVKGYLTENPVVAIPSTLEDITESQSDRITNLDSDFLKIKDHSFHGSVNTIYKGDNQVQKTLGNEKIQSTMRLMGKEFIVGGKGFHGFEDGHVWKDKQIIDELHFGNNSVSNVVVPGRTEPSLGKLGETLFCPSEIAINHRSESMCTLPNFDGQTSSSYQGVFVARNIDPVQKLYPSLSPRNFSEVGNGGCSFSQPLTSGYESRLFSLELPTPATAHQESCPSVSSSGIQMKNKQNLPHPPISAIRFPFMHPDLEGHATSSWTRRSTMDRPPPCFDVSKKGTQLNNSQSYCSLGHNRPYIMPGAIPATDSVSFKPETFCSVRPFSSGFTLQSSVAPASLAPNLLTQHTAMPCHPVVLSVPGVQKRHGKQKRIKERIKSGVNVSSLNNGKKSRRQSLALSNVPFKPLKVPSLGFHEGSQCGIKKPTACTDFEGSVQNIEKAFESCSALKSNIVMHGEYEADKDEQIIYPWMDSYADTARTGPIRLIAGTKHILKACQQIDQSSSKSTDLNISLSATSTDFKLSESENSARIYRFAEKAPIFE